MWDTFVHKLDSLILKFVPRIKGASYVVRKSPWLPLAVRRTIAAKAATWRQWRLNPCRDTKIRYNALAKTAKKRLFNFRRQQEELVLNSRNLKAFYQYVNKRLNPSPKPIKLILPNGDITQCNIQIGELFYKFFSSVFTVDNGSLPIPPPPTDALMQDVTFSIDKIRKKLVELKESSSCGPDGIHPSVLKHSADALGYTAYCNF